MKSNTTWKVLDNKGNFVGTVKAHSAAMAIEIADLKFSRLFKSDFWTVLLA